VRDLKEYNLANSLQQTPVAGADLAEEVEQYDVIIIGAGITGLYQLYRIRQLGLSVRVFDDGGGVGGTWYWNRYPGARFDSESYTYGYSFSEELLQEWDWKEHYSGQPENERYLNYVADKFDLRRDIQLNARVSSAVYDDRESRWQVQTEDGRRAGAQFLIAAIGPLSACYIPDIEGLGNFNGAWCHTGKWPMEGMDLAGKRVGVIGTGATAVQLIPEIAKEVAHLTVFQRSANYCSPLRNSPIGPDWQREIKASYPAIFKKCSETPGSFMHEFDPRSALEVSPEERLAQYERLWAEPGFKKFLANFQDIVIPGEANEDYAEFIRNKIRPRVKDPVVAEKLVPKDHPFLSKRPPCESGYYEVYNQDNVLLVIVREAPIERITPKGIKTSATEYEVDVIIFATGYDAVTGSLTRIDIYGQDGQTLKDKFAQGPRNYLGVQSAGFPNLFLINGGLGGNFPRAAEQLVEWVTNCVRYVQEHQFTRISATPQAEEAWSKNVAAAGAKLLRTKADSWAVGANIPGKARAYLGSPYNAPVMRAKRLEVAANGYEGFLLQ
jgi:cation diffusion facilitator CzcD-associated flavoprotein CzcO